MPARFVNLDRDTPLLLALILYRYASGVFGNRRIEQATFDNVPTRLICADTHPDHDPICTFQRQNQALVNEAFVKVLAMAQELRFLKVGQITVAEVMKHRLRTRAGKAKYQLRQQTVEPVFGIIKSVMGFRRFLWRGLEKVSIEWTWVSLAYNIKRMHRMQWVG